MHRDYDARIHDEQAGDNPPDSLTHCNPDDRNKTQIKMIVTVPWAEDYEEDGEYRQSLARRLYDPSKGKFRQGKTPSRGTAL
jgi:hypothetical protein